jgi:ABC-type multidrug transport system fused ATPase/permease subunit
MVWTDKRARLLQELLAGMKVVKLMAWEKPFLKRLDGIRQNELKYIRKLMVTRSANMAIAMSSKLHSRLPSICDFPLNTALTDFPVPVIAAILSFVTYASTGGDLDPATLFTVLTLFQLLRLPLMIYPMTLSAITDAYNALGRLSNVFMAEVFAETR